MSFFVRPLRRCQFSKVLSLVALAAFILGGTPRIGCICSDGHYELFCQRRAAAAGAAQTCSCCTAAKASSPSHSCCAKRPATANENLSSSGSIGFPCCCHPVLSVPSVAAKAPQKDLGRRDLSAMPYGWAETRSMPWDAAATRESRLDRLIRPPIDLVIVLERLTI